MLPSAATKTEMAGPPGQARALGSRFVRRFARPRRSSGSWPPQLWRQVGRLEHACHGRVRLLLLRQATLGGAAHAPAAAAEAAAGGPSSHVAEALAGRALTSEPNQKHLLSSPKRVLPDPTTPYSCPDKVPARGLHGQQPFRGRPARLGLQVGPSRLAPHLSSAPPADPGLGYYRDAAP